MNYKILILASLFFSRHKEGSDSSENYLDFAKKFEAKLKADFALDNSVSTGFFSALSGAQDLISSSPDAVEKILRDIYAQSKLVSPGEMFSADAKGLIRDI